MSVSLIIIENIADLASLLLVSITIYLGFKIVRLSREMELVALKGGRAPYYIITGVFFLGLNRLLDFLAEPLSPILGEEISLALDDAPGALAALFIFFGLRNMYLLYRKSSNKGAKVTAEELWVDTEDGVMGGQSGLNHRSELRKRRRNDTRINSVVQHNVTYRIADPFDLLEEDTCVLY